MMKYIILLSILINVLSYKSRPINYYKIPKYVERMFEKQKMPKRKNNVNMEQVKKLPNYISENILPYNPELFYKFHFKPVEPITDY